MPKTRRRNRRVTRGRTQGKPKRRGAARQPENFGGLPGVVPGDGVRGAEQCSGAIDSRRNARACAGRGAEIQLSTELAGAFASKTANVYRGRAGAGAERRLP